MAKYYVQSGSMKMVVAAEDARRAALWAVHRAMEQVVPVDHDPEDDVTAKPSSAPIVLSGKVRYSEKGFGGEGVEAGDFNTIELVAEWSQLMAALNRMGL